MHTFWHQVWKQFKKHLIGYTSLWIVVLFALAGIYAPFLASSRPLFVYYDDSYYFPLFRYLFYQGFFTKPLDLFFNLLMFTFPLFIIVTIALRGRHYLRNCLLFALTALQVIIFLSLLLFPIDNPAFSPYLEKNSLDWPQEVASMNPYGKLNILIRQKNLFDQQQKLIQYNEAYKKAAAKQGLSISLPTLWQTENDNETERVLLLNQSLLVHPLDSPEHKALETIAKYIQERRSWIDSNITNLKYEIMPPLSHFHWQEDAGGSMLLNRFIPWWELVRINHKDLTAALIFGIRISLVVGIISVAISLAIGIPIGAVSGFFGGRFDIIVCRLMEMWESMPTFFMLLFVVAIAQSKSVFLVIGIIGFFGWTGFSRFLRGEFFKQRNLLYVEACHSLGFSNRHIIFSHIFPNAIPPLLTLLPFAMMGAISGEAGLSFLGLGEEGSTSWGVLMDEGRTVFPGDAYLLWPPALLLTILLISIALVGDSLRDSLDPKTHLV